VTYCSDRVLLINAVVSYCFHQVRSRGLGQFLGLKAREGARGAHSSLRTHKYVGVRQGSLDKATMLGSIGDVLGKWQWQARSSTTGIWHTEARRRAARTTRLVNAVGWSLGQLYADVLRHDASHTVAE
jgi:hypothetical protein